MRKKAIFIAATGQNVGKTTLCLGMAAALKRRFEKVGFIKPIGQHHVAVDEQVNVDKDAVLFKSYFHLQDEWKDLSPVIIPSGFTRSFLDGQVNEIELIDKVKSAFEHIALQHAYTIVEGTGHVGVGEIINLSNAKIAKALGLDVVMIASGGLGSALDELALNISMCRENGVNVRGVILNRVLAEKRKMILEYFPKALAKWNIPLIGAVPYSKALSQPTMQDFETLFSTSLVSGHLYHYRRFDHTRLVAGSVEAYIPEIAENQLIITPASREDIILCTLEKQKKFQEKEGKDFGAGMILTSLKSPSEYILGEIKKADIPVIYVPMCSYDAMKMITSFVAKIRGEDLLKIEQAIDLVENHIDFRLLTGILS